MNKFALFSVLALVLAFTSSAQAGEECMKKMEAAIKQCATDLKLTPSELAFDKDFAQFSNGTKCLFKCVGEALGAFKDGKIVESTVLNMMKEHQKDHPEDKEMDDVIYKKCKDISEECPCATAAKMFLCAREAAAPYAKARMQKKN